MPYDTDNRSGITKNASESQKRKVSVLTFLFCDVVCTAYVLM